MSIVSLPIELHFAIVEELGSPIHPDAYRLSDGCYHALAQVCLVNRAMCDVAERSLYARPFITPASLPLFARTVYEEKRTTGSGTSFIPTRKGWLVESLALSNFHEEPTLSQIHQIAGIIYALTGHMKRLFLDVFLRSVDYASPLDTDSTASLRSALHGLNSLSEFCLSGYLSWKFEPTPWASATNLRRLASFQTNLHYKLVNNLERFSALETFIAAFPLITGTHVMGTPFQRVFRLVKERFRQLLIVMPAEQQCMYSIGLRKLLAEVMESEDAASQSPARRALLRIGQAGQTADQPHVADSYDRQRKWFVEAVAEGTLWSTATTPWDVYIGTNGSINTS